MHKRNAYTLIQVGLWIRHLQNAATLKLSSVRTGIGVLKQELKESAFDVSGVAAGGLCEFLTTLKSLPDQELLRARPAPTTYEGECYHSKTRYSLRRRQNIITSLPLAVIMRVIC